MTDTSPAAAPTESEKPNGNPGGGIPRRLSIRALARLAAAIKILTRFRIFQDRQWPEGVMQESIIWFPFIGLVIGAFGAAIDGIGSLMGMTPFVTAPLALAGMIWISGALHEGGLANMSDGFGGGATREQKLEIMQDSRIGTYGTVVVTLSLITKAGAISSLSSSDTVFAGLVIACVWSRVLMPLVAAWLGPVRADDPVAQLGKPSGERLTISLIFAVLITLFLADATAAGLMLGAGLLAALAVAVLAQRQIGGFTRDVLGATQQIVELSMLVMLVASQAG
ncbi:MAG: adenosylcobinamide-GDP ribazoletransferase [Bdellovibrionales bacterium]